MKEAQSKHSKEQANSYDDSLRPTNNNEAIGEVINNFVFSLQDYIRVITITVPHLGKTIEREMNRNIAILDEFIDNNLSKTEKTENAPAHQVKKLLDATEQLDQLKNSRPIESLVRSLFIGLFSEYDAYIGNLIKLFYQEKPSLFEGIAREIKLSDLLLFTDIESVKMDMLDKEIDSIRRDSYVDQFSHLSSKFGIPLTDFKEWHEFVELSQRRNLFTHTDGIVSDQYLMVCKKHKCKIDDGLKSGIQLNIPPEYMLRAIFVLSKVGFMLGHTLWKKILPHKSQASGDCINLTLYSLMQRRSWNFCAEFAEFGLQQQQLKDVDALTKKIRYINCAISLKQLGKTKEALELLDKQDWTGCIREFSLALAVLKENYSEAAMIMKQIGKNGEIIQELSYHRWPLFFDFRNTTEFQTAYQEIYDISFLEKTGEDAEKKSKTNLSLEIAVKKKDKSIKKRMKKNKEVDGATEPSSA